MHRKTKVRKCKGTLSPRWLGYAIAVGGTAFAVLVRWEFGLISGKLPLYSTFYLVVFGAAVVGGVKPGLLATFLSLLSVDLFFIQSVGNLAMKNFGDIFSLGLFGLVNVCISFLGGRFRMQSEELWESEARLRMAHQAAHIGAFEWNVQTGINHWTPELEAMYGLKPGEFEGTEEDWEQLVHPEDQAKAVETVNRALVTFQPEEGEWRVVWPDGTVHWLVGRFQASKDQAGKLWRLTGVNIDVTEKRQAEEAVRQSEKRLRQFIDEAPVAMAMFDTEMRYLAVSRRWLENYCIPNQSVLGRSYYEIFPEIPERWKQIHRRCLAGAVERADEDLFERADGRRQWIRWEIQPWYSAPGIIGGLTIFSEEITARKEAVEALRQSEERFRTLADAIPQLVWIARPDGYLFWFNRRCFEYTGASREQLEGWAWQGLHDPQMLPIVLEKWRQSIATGKPFDMEVPLRRADGCFRAFLTRVMPLQDNEGRVVLWFGTHTDITDQKRAEAEITALRDRLAADLAGMNRLHTLSTRLVSQGELKVLLDAILDAAIEIIGGDKGHVQLYDAASGKLGIMAQRGFDPAFINYSSQIRPGVLASGFALQTHQRVIVEDITKSPLYTSQPRALDLMLAAGVRSVVCTPLLTRAGQLVGTISILFGAPHQPCERDLRLLDLLARQAADFIERTQAETALLAAKEELARVNQDLEEKVQQRTAKLQETVNELEHFSYTITHDMRAPLRAMQNYAHIMLEEECATCLQGVPKDYLKRIQMAARRMDALIVDALQYSRTLRGDFPVGPVDISAVLRGILQSYPNLQPPKVQIQLEGEFPSVLGNEAGLTQCFSNLLGNAVKFVQPDKTPQVRVWAEQREGFARVWVEDNGIGIPKEYQGRIWEMFQTLEKRSDGTGIGLALVRKVVDRMGGRTGVESEPGQGSRFWVELKQPARNTK